MKSRTTIILVFLALIIGGFAYWDYKKGTSTEQAKEKAKRLLDFKAADVTRLELVRSNETIVAEKTGEHWEIKKPLAVKADDSALGAVLDQLEFAERERTFNENDITSARLADYGLAAPQLQVSMRGKKGDVLVLFGSETPTKEAVYVQVQGQKTVALVRKDLFERANASLDSLRNRKVMDFVSTAATRLEIKTADRMLELAKSAAKPGAEPRWAIVKPIQTRADQQKTGDLLNDLNGLRVQDFVSEDSKEMHTYQLDDPQSEVTVWTGDKGQTFLIGRSPTNDTSKVYAKLKSADSIFTVSADNAKKFALQVNDLRDTRLLTFTENSLHAIEVARGADKVTLTRTGRIWNVAGPVRVTAEESVVQDLMRRLNELTTTQFVADVATDLGKYGLAAPLLTVTLQGEGTNILAQLLVGSSDAAGKTRYVKRGDEPFVYGVEKNILNWIPTSRLTCRARRVADLKVDQVGKLTVERAGSSVVVGRGLDKKWKMIEPPQGVLDNDRLQRVLDVIGFLQAEEILREGIDNLVEYGLDKPEAKFTIESSGKTYILQLGKAGNADATFASWSDPSLVFTLGSATVGTLTNSLVTPLSATNRPPTAVTPPAIKATAQ